MSLRIGLAVKKHRGAPRLGDWLEANIPEGLAVFALARSHRRRLRTSNMLERLNEEIKRRTRVAGLVPERGVGPPSGECGADGDQR